MTPENPDALTGPLPRDMTGALQAALAAEHATAYAYGVAGAHLEGGERRTASAGYAAALIRRDRLAALVTDGGGAPVAAAAAYTLPEPVEDAAAALRLLVTVETRLSAVYADLVAASTGGVRLLAAGALQDAAVRVVTVSGEPAGAFPGLPERD